MKMWAAIKIIRMIFVLKLKTPHEQFTQTASALLISWLLLVNASLAPLQLPPEASMKILLIHLRCVSVPAVVGEQCYVSCWNGAHLHRWCGPLDRAEVVEVLMEDERWGATLWRSVWWIRQPALLHHTLSWNEERLQLFLGQRFRRKKLPDGFLAARRSRVTWSDVDRIQGAQTGKAQFLIICCENVRDEKLARFPSGVQVGDVETPVD